MSERQPTPDSKNGKTQTVFIHKLYDMLHDPSISHLIWWSPTNDSFYLLPGEEFSKVLSQYFKHTNIASFIRQLNMYGFHKVNDTFTATLTGDDERKNSTGSSPSPSSPTSSATKWEFRHSTNQFRKGDVNSLKLIKRRSSKNINSHKEIVNLNSIPHTSNPMMLDPSYVYQKQQPQPQPQPSQQPQQSQPPVQPQKLLHQQLPQPPQLPTSQAQLQQPHQLPDDHHDPHTQLPRYQPSPTSSRAPTSPGPTSKQLDFSIRPPLMTNPSFEHSINLRFIELNNQIYNLKNELASTNSMFMTEMRRNQSDMMHLLDAFEKYVHNSSKVSSTLSVPSLDTPDRLGNNKTPTNRQSNDSDVDQSPMSKIPTNANTSNSASTNANSSIAIGRAIENEIKSLKSNIMSRLDSQHQAPPSVNTYHLGDVSSRHSSNPNLQIVPQNYPLNPNYTIYPHSEVAFRNMKLQTQQSHRPPEHRQSVHVPPLQPIPSRKNSTVLLEEHNQLPASNNHLTNSILRSDTKSNSPLSINGNAQQNNPKSPMDPLLTKSVSPHSQLALGSEKDKSVFQQQSIKSYSQYPFPNMVPDYNNGPSANQSKRSSISSSRHTSTRTNSLPVPIIDYSAPTPLQHELQNGQTPNYYYQRNSFTSIYDQRRSIVTPHTSIPYPFSPVQQLVQQQTIPSLQKQPTAPKTSLMTLNSVRTSSPSTNSMQRLPSPLSTNLPRSTPNPSTTPKVEKTTKNQLPSVSELDKSLKAPSNSYAPMPSILNIQDSPIDIKEETNGGLESKAKKRKLTENTTIKQT